MPRTAPPTVSLQNSSYILDCAPQVCPRCSRNIEAICSHVFSRSRRLEGCLEVVFSCPSCAGLFIGVYSQPNSFALRYDFQFVLPSEITERSFPHLDLISADFSNIYNQAAQAEGHRLLLVAGPGYRKALEFLIKDYCIALFPEAASKIRSQQLWPVIKEFVKKEQIQRAAKLTAWVGNDETHYERKTFTDINDLKNLLEITITAINGDVELEKYERSMDATHQPKMTFLAAASPS